jgi:hypothetical protein
MCCVCEKSIIDGSNLRPVRCFQWNSERSHTLCSTCWFTGKDGRIPFAREGENHNCPGCEKQLPLYPKIKTFVKDNVAIIDLTSE